MSLYTIKLQLYHARWLSQIPSNPLEDLRFSSFRLNFRLFFFLIWFLYKMHVSHSQPDECTIESCAIKKTNSVILGLAQFLFCRFFSVRIAHISTFTKTHFIIFICLSLCFHQLLFFLAHTSGGIRRGKHYALKTNQQTNIANGQKNERHENNHKYAKYSFWFKHQRTRPLPQKWI